MDIQSVALVFGGCCANVVTLENLVQSNPQVGNIVTVSQFLLVTIVGLLSPWKSKRSKVPMVEWGIASAMFFSVSILNNWVWAFNVSVPVHIIFRSSGTAVTMVVGYLWGKRYNWGQIFSSMILSVGVIVATLSTKTDSSMGVFSAEDKMKFYTGLFILFVAAVIYAVMGLYNENIYKKYGNQWKENLFYTHFYSLPFFLFILPQLSKEFKLMWNHPNVIKIADNFVVHEQLLYLAVNCITQYGCISGVNRLAGSTSALTVSVVLLVRKFASLFLSMIFFGNNLTPTGCLGALLVFLGALLYSYSSSKGETQTEKEKKNI